MVRLFKEVWRTVSVLSKEVREELAKLTEYELEANRPKYRSAWSGYEDSLDWESQWDYPDFWESYERS